jgi:hypothetical protein
MKKNELKPNIILRRETLESELLSGPNKTYILSRTEKVETYGFFIRAIHEQFNPCTSCQIEVKKILMTQGFNLHYQRMHVSLEQSIVNGVCFIFCSAKISLSVHLETML